MRLLVTLAVSLVLVSAVAAPLLEAGLYQNARDEGLRLVQADARGLAQVARDVEGGEDALGEAKQLLRIIAERQYVVDVRLIDADRRTVASPKDSELGEIETERSVDEALRFGRSFAGSEEEAGDRTGDLQYVTPVDLPSGRHALELDEDAAFVERQVAAARRLLLNVLVASIGACVVLFYLLGGRRLSRLHRVALDRARQDGLTDLGSQRAFHEELDRAVAVAVRHCEPLSLVTFDLDEFKLANDRYGHAHGDELLKQVAEVLRRGRRGDLAFRTGGDEFALLLPRTDGQAAARLARRLSGELAEAGAIRASIGVAELCPGRQVEPGILYEQADAAAYQVKRQGGDGVLAFCEVRDAEVLVGPAKARALFDLLEEGDLAMAFQMVCDLETLRPIGYEALARPADRYGFAGPADAFAAAEQLRRVPDLDALCRQRAFEQGGLLPPDVLLFVNLSPRSLENPRIDHDLSRQALEAGFSPARVVLEITEREQVRASTIACAVERLRAAGFQLALDDVGSGNSGLELLRLAVFDFVKIDRSVITAAVSDSAARGVLLAIDAFARQTGAFVIAEGIEDEQVLDFVHGLDEHQRLRAPVRRGGQGFALGRPGPCPTAENLSSSALPAGL
ncbi:MAG: bifunctional diguanylate cyclase/phosphodiesterase [Actinomycetota bacterium]|nr:bifunctional diguanylate cyclase/phosphodiesterase [Actinomycetota bacterium]